MNLKDQIAFFEEAPLLLQGETVGWECVAYSSESRAIGGGCGRNIETARQVAIAETVERIFLSRLSDSQARREWCLDIVPTSCGFAAGFEKANTLGRAVSEAIERWSWSHWIDCDQKLQEVVPSNLSSFTLAQVQTFDRVKYFEAYGECVFGIKKIPFVFRVLVGFKDSGAFPGSSVALLDSSTGSDLADGWDHGATEALRHYYISKEVVKNAKRADTFPLYFSRVSFFSGNAKFLEEEILVGKVAPKGEKARLTAYPRVNFFKEAVVDGESKAFVARALCEGYLPWHMGANSRFVY